MKVVVVGGGYAGMMAVGRLARRLPEIELTLVDATGVMVQRTRLHEQAAGRQVSGLDLRRALVPLGVRVIVDAMVGIAGGTIRLASGRTLAYDRLILALGSRYSRPESMRLAQRLDSPEAAARIARRAVSARHTTVIGAGLTGIELASELAYSGKGGKVRLVDSSVFGGSLSPGAAGWVRARLGRVGVEIIERERVDEVGPDHVHVGGARLPSDLSIWAGGLACYPVVGNLGQPLDRLGRLQVDGCLRVPGLPGVYAAGDAAGVRGRPWIDRSCAAAMPMGAHAAENVLAELRGGAPAELDYGSILRCVSLGRRAGVVQWTDRQGASVERWMGGPLAAWTKRGILAMTMVAPALERRFRRPLYGWPTGGARPELPVLAQGQ